MYYYYHCFKVLLFSVIATSYDDLCWENKEMYLSYTKICRHNVDGHSFVYGREVWHLCCFLHHLCLHCRTPPNIGSKLGHRSELPERSFWRNCFSLYHILGNTSLRYTNSQCSPRRMQIARTKWILQ